MLKIYLPIIIQLMLTQLLQKYIIYNCLLVILFKMKTIKHKLFLRKILTFRNLSEAYYKK